MVFFEYLWPSSTCVTYPPFCSQYYLLYSLPFLTASTMLCYHSIHIAVLTRTATATSSTPKAAGNPFRSRTSHTSIRHLPRRQALLIMCRKPCPPSLHLKLRAEESITSGNLTKPAKPPMHKPCQIRKMCQNRPGVLSRIHGIAWRVWESSRMLPSPGEYMSLLVVALGI